MKKLVLITLVMLVNMKTYGQQTSDKIFLKDFYINKSKNQNTAGWVLLLTGTVMVVGGSIAFDKSWDNGSNSETDNSGFFILGGLVADLVSIPFFISSGVNKRKAASISFNYQNYPLSCQNTSFKTTLASATISVKF